MDKNSIFLLIVAIAVCSSCLSDEQKKQRANEEADRRMKEIDMTSIDKYPLFENCDEMLSAPDCFYEQLHEVIDEKLKLGAISFKLDGKDSLYASISVSKEGHIKYDSIFKCAAALDKDQMHELLKTRLNNFPIIGSALKKSRPVATTYRLPIVFSPVDSLTY